MFEWWTRRWRRLYDFNALCFNNFRGGFISRFVLVLSLTKETSVGTEYTVLDGHLFNIRLSPMILFQVLDLV